MGDHSNGQLFPEEDMPLRASSAQQILPLFRPQELADQLGLNWWAVLKLRDDGWLSFDPEKEQITDDGMEAEFVFLGSLVSAGCDPRMLAALLEGLEKPYRYHIGGVYYDWRTREWRGLPREREPPWPSYQQVQGPLQQPTPVLWIRKPLQALPQAQELPRLSSRQRQAPLQP